MPAILFLKPFHIHKNRNFRPAAVLVLIMLCFNGISQKLKDTLYFKNGSVVIGELKKIKMGVVTFDPDDANDITVQLRKVKAVVGASDIFRVETLHSGVNYGFLQRDSVDNRVRILLGRQQTTIEIEDIFNLYSISNKFSNRFSGTIGAGYSYSRSSEFGRINLDGSLNYQSKLQELKLTVSLIYSQTDSGFSRDREEMNLKDNFYFSNRSFATAFLKYQRNLELGLDRRFQEGAGLGNKFITTKAVYAWCRAGLVFNQEKSTEGKYSGWLTEVFGQLQFNLFRYEKPEINLDFTQTIYAGLTDKGRIRTDGEINLNWELLNDLELNINLYNNYDSKPPVKEGSTFDFGVVIGFQYKF